MENNQTAANNFPKKLDMLKKPGLKQAIDELMLKESKYIPVADVCKEYLGKLNDGYQEEELLESFISVLAKVATHESTKNTVAKLSAVYENHKRDIENVKTLYEISKGSYNYIVPMVESSVVEYMISKNNETRQLARQTLHLFEGVPGLNVVAENLSFDEYEEKTGKSLINSVLDESALPKPKKTYTQEELDEIVENAKATAISEAAEIESKKKEVSYKSIETHIDLSGAISRILERENKNESLRAFCEQYISAKNIGKSDEILYESFISGLSNWNFLNAVDTELSAMTDRISKYKQEIDLKKILDTMSQTGSYYIVPLIEGVVIDYVNNKSMTNKAILKQRLEAFEYDPFVRDILYIIQRDLSKANTVYLGESVELVNSRVHTEKIYSPVLYVKENECIFNVKGNYFNRKGNTITKLTKSAVNSLDESFKTLCSVLNSNNVVFDEPTDSIKIYDNNDIAVVNESEIIINGDSVTTQELENLASMSKLMNEHKERFYSTINLINENYNKIAYIDFVKRVALNESNAKTADVFRIKNNIFVHTTDNVLGKSVFYRNINPMQCRSYLNEHMEINVSSLFEDVLPNQDSIQKDIDDTKKQYEDYIADLESKKKELESMKDESDDDTLKDIESAIDLIETELEEVKNNYKDYQKESDKFTGADDSEADKTVEDPVPDDDEEKSDTDATDTPDKDSGDESRVPDETPSEDELSDPIDGQTEDIVEQEPTATPYDGLLDVPVTDDGYEIVKVSYQQNVKSGKVSGRGEVYLMIPSVNANGDVQNEFKKVSFYLDSERNPVLNNEYMPLAMYNAIKNAIVEAPETQTVELVSGDETPANDTLDSESLPATVDDTLVNDILDDPVSDTDNPTETETSSEEEPVEDMFGLEDDPDTIDSFEDIDDTDTLSDEETTDIDNTTDSSFGEDTDDTKGVEIENVERETPAETENKKVAPTYPIEIGLGYNDILPIKPERFEDSMDKLGIERSTPEGFGKHGCCLCVKNKADAYALRDYFKEWKNFDDEDFDAFFPELAECFKTPAPKATNESVRILCVHAINESVALKENKQGSVSLKIPTTSKYLRAFELTHDEKIDETIKAVIMTTDNYEESAEIYRKAQALYEAYNGRVVKTVKHFLDKYKSDFGKNSVRTLKTEYSNLLESKITNAGIMTRVLNDNLIISVTPENETKLKKIFEGYYKESIPKSVTDFFRKSEESLQEGLKITIRDDNSGKTIEFDTDDLNKDASSVSSTGTDGSAPADAVSDDYTTFKVDDSQLFGGSDSSDDDADDEDKDKKDKKDSDKDEKSKDQETDKKVSDNESEESEEEQETKKKLKFKVKRKKKSSDDESDKTDESVKTVKGKTLNESAQPNVLDWVLYKGEKCQVIGKLANDDFILNCQGRTVQCSQKEVKLVSKKMDSVPNQFKFDMKTLKALHEQMVHAGLFMNNNRISPNDCFVKYSEYKQATDNDDVRLIIEGETTFANKKYVKLLEDVNDFANPDDYVDGVEISFEGQVLRKLKMNVKDYETGVGSSAPVRVLIDCDVDECKLIQLPKGSLLYNTMD